MIYFKELDEHIDKFAEMLSEELAQRQFYSADEFRAFAKTRLFFALEQLAKTQSNDLEKQHSGLAEAYTSNIPKHQKISIQAQLTELRPKLKEAKRLTYSFRQYNEYDQIKHYLKAKGMNELIQDFLKNYLNKGENGTHQALRTGSEMFSGDNNKKG